MPSDPDDITAEEAHVLARRPDLSPEDRRFVVSVLRDPSPTVRAMARLMIAMSRDELGECMAYLDDPVAPRAIARAPLN